MNRYPQNSATVFTRFDGKRVLRTTTYPPIPISNSDIYVISGEDDYLDALADKYYKQASYWWVIAQANGIRGTIKAPVGVQLRIPADINTVLARFNSENS